MRIIAFFNLENYALMFNNFQYFHRPSIVVGMFFIVTIAIASSFDLEMPTFSNSSTNSIVIENKESGGPDLNKRDAIKTEVTATYFQSSDEGGVIGIKTNNRFDKIGDNFFLICLIIFFD